MGVRAQKRCGAGPADSTDREPAGRKRCRYHPRLPDNDRATPTSAAVPCRAGRVAEPAETPAADTAPARSDPGDGAGSCRREPAPDRTDDADSSPPPSAAASLNQTAAAKRASPETPPDPTSDSRRWKTSARKPSQRPPQILHEPPAAIRACSHPCATSTHPSLDTSFVW